MEKKVLKIKFVDFWPDFNSKDNFIKNAISDKYSVEISDTPEYLFFSVFSDHHLKYECIKIFFSGENLCPDFNLCDYAIGSELLTFGDRYFRFPFFYLYPEICMKMEKKHLVADLSVKQSFCSFVYSNDQADPLRERMFRELSKYKAVDSGGGYKNNIGGRCENKLLFEQTHKFSIAFENSSHPGYATEKIADSFAAGCVPIYWGDPNIEDYFNSEAFINVMKFPDLESAIQRVQEIDQDEKTYEKMLQTPALLNENDSYDKTIERLTEFLSTVFEQDSEKAYRRNTLFWGKMYLDKLNAYSDSYKELIRLKMLGHKLVPFKGLRDKIKKGLEKRSMK